MQKVIVQVDWHTKIILTLIAVLLAGVFIKSYFPSNTPETRASAAGMLTRDMRGLHSNTPYSKCQAYKVAALYEGSNLLAEYLYLYNLQDLPQEKAFKIINESPILLGYPRGKSYAKCLVVSERNEVYRHLSPEVIKTVLSSGRFEVTPDGIVQRALKVEIVSRSTAEERRQETWQE